MWKAGPAALRLGNRRGRDPLSGLLEQGVCLLVGRGHGRLRIGATGNLLDCVLDQSVDLVTVREDGNREGLLVLNDGGECRVVLALCLACLQGRFGALDAGGEDDAGLTDLDLALVGSHVGDPLECLIGVLRACRPFMALRRPTGPIGRGA